MEIELILLYLMSEGSSIQPLYVPHFHKPYIIKITRTFKPVAIVGLKNCLSSFDRIQYFAPVLVFSDYDPREALGRIGEMGSQSPPPVAVVGARTPADGLCRGRPLATGLILLLVIGSIALYSHGPGLDGAKGVLPVVNSPWFRTAVKTRESVSPSLQTDSLPITNFDFNASDAVKDVEIDVEKLTYLLEQRLAAPNPANKIIYSDPCDLKGPGLTGCTSNCTNAPSLDDRPYRERISNLVQSPELHLKPEQRAAILSISTNIPEADVIIVSASSSNHFNEMQAMLENLHTVVYPIMSTQGRNFSVVVFDLGLTDAERKLTEQKCRCQVVSFPTHIFPEHVSDKHCYSWKPIIVRSVIERARKGVVWQDASIRWTKEFPTMFDNMEKFGHQIVRYKISSRVTANTLKQTFDYMHEDVCPFFPFPEIQATVQLHHKDPLTVHAVLEPWCRCALEKQCICPAKPGSVLGCSKTKTLHRCHRFDQSALSIVLAKLYASNMYKVMAPEWSFMEPNIVAIKREHKKPGYLSSL